MSIGRNVSTNLIRNVYYSTQSQKKGTSAMFTLTSCWRRLLLSYLLLYPASLILNAHFCVSSYRSKPLIVSCSDPFFSELGRVKLG